MASVLRIVAAGLVAVGLAIAGWLGYLLWPIRARIDGREWLGLLYNFGYLLLLPGLAFGLAGVFGSVVRLTTPRPGGRWAGPLLRVLASVMAVSGVAALVVCYDIHWQQWKAAVRLEARPWARVPYLISYRTGPNTDFAWITLGVAGLLGASARGAYPRRADPHRGRTMATFLRLLSILLVGVGVVGFVTIAGLSAAIFVDPKLLHPDNPFVRYTFLLFHTHLSMVVIGLGGVLWVAVRLAYPPKPRPSTAAPLPAPATRS